MYWYQQNNKSKVSQQYKKVNYAFSKLTAFRDDDSGVCIDVIIYNIASFDTTTSTTTNTICCFSSSVNGFVQNFSNDIATTTTHEPIYYLGITRYFTSWIFHFHEVQCPHKCHYSIDIHHNLQSQECHCIQTITTTQQYYVMV